MSGYGQHVCVDLSRVKQRHDELNHDTCWRPGVAHSKTDRPVHHTHIFSKIDWTFFCRVVEDLKEGCTNVFFANNVPVLYIASADFERPRSMPFFDGSQRLVDCPKP